MKSSLQIKKHRFRFTSPAYLTFIREQPCIVCKHLGLIQTTKTEASHSTSRKWAEGGDSTCLSVSRQFHPQSTKSANDILLKHGLDPEEEIRKSQEKFMRHMGFTPSPDQDFEEWCIATGLGAYDDKSKRKNRKAHTPYTKPF